MISEERVIWLMENLTEAELKAGFNAIQTLLDLELEFSAGEQEDIDKAIRRLKKIIWRKPQEVE